MAKSDTNLLTQAEYARWRKGCGLSGGSREAVRRAVDEKRISVFGPDRLIDQVLADSQWERNTRARLSPQAAAATSGADLASGTGSAMETGTQASQPDLLAKPSLDPAPNLTARSGASAAAPSAPVNDNGYTDARARRERAEAEEAEMRTARIRGTIVLREDVDRAFFEIMREVRDRLTGCARRVASEVASISSAEACESVIDREHRITLELLTTTFREKLGATPIAGGTA